MSSVYSHCNPWAKCKLVRALFLLADKVLTWESKILSNAKENALYENWFYINQQLFWADRNFQIYIDKQKGWKKLAVGFQVIKTFLLPVIVINISSHMPRASKSMVLGAGTTVEGTCCFWYSFMDLLSVHVLEVVQLLFSWNLTTYVKILESSE